MSPRDPRHDSISPIYRDMRALAKSASGDWLAASLDALNDEAGTVEARWSDVVDDVVRANTVAYDLYAIGERRRAIDDEITLRTRVSGSLSATRLTQEHEAWRDLARLVRERTDVAELLTATGIDLRRAGRDPRRGGFEWCGPCPLCGGSDRLRVWDGPNGRAWCRQCRWTADAIVIAQSFLPGCAHFRDAVRTLAELCSMREAVPA